MARQKLGDMLQDVRCSSQAGRKIAAGKMSFNEAVNLLRERTASDGSLKPKSKKNREQTITCIFKTWPAPRFRRGRQTAPEGLARRRSDHDMKLGGMARLECLDLKGTGTGIFKTSEPVPTSDIWSLW